VKNAETAPRPATAVNVVLCKWQPELLSALLDLGADVCLILDRYDRMGEKPDAALTDRCRKVYQVSSFDSLEEVAAVAVDVRFGGFPVDRVVSHSELSQFGAGYLELLVGTESRAFLHVGHRDKRLMKDLVRAAGVPTARFRSVSDPGDLTALPGIAAELPMPVVVKPAAGYGGVSTLRADDAAALDAAVQGFTFDPLLRSRHLIVEEFVEGYELAVDSIWIDGRAATLVVHRYHEPRLNMNEPTRLDGSSVLHPEDHPELYERIRALHERVNDALGIRDCATHMEIFVRPDGELVFSEIGARIGGAWIPGLLSAHLGRSVWQLLAEAIVLGACSPGEPRHRNSAAVHVRPTRPGTITAFPTDDALAEFSGMVSWRRLRGVGERARLNHPSDYYLHIVVGAESPEAIEALCIQVAQTFTIDTAEWTPTARAAATVG
jgi:formate-dependent phosphoribosylglycinamide formyltransferase (GAR transformylase)